MTRVYGSKYNGELNTKEIAKLIREELKLEVKNNPLFTGAKFSVRKSDHSSISVCTTAMGFNPINPEWVEDREKNPHGYYNNIDRKTEDGKKFIARIESIAAAYNHDGSDLYSDYYDVNFYFSCSIDYRLEDEFIKDISDNLQECIAAYRKSIIDNMPCCSACGSKTEETHTFGELQGLCWECYYPHYKREQERKAEEANMARSAQMARVERLHGLQAVRCEQIICKVALPHCNKQSTIAEYKEQLHDENDFDVVNGRISEVVTMTTEQYDFFKDNLLEDFPWLDGKGGCDSTADVREVEHFYQLTPEEQEIWREKSYSIFVAVTAPGREVLLIDPQGYSYARYVGFPIVSRQHPEKPKAKIYHLTEYKQRRAMAH